MTTLFALYGKPLPISVLRDPVPIISELNCSDSMKAIIERSIQWSIRLRFSNISDFCSDITKIIEEQNYRAAQNTDHLSTLHRDIRLANLFLSSFITEETQSVIPSTRSPIINRRKITQKAINSILSGHLARSSIHPKSEALILLLEVKFKPLSPGQRQRILDCNTDLLLDDWLARISTATSVEDVLGKTIEEIMGFKK